MTRTPVPAPDQPTTSTTALAALTGPTNLPVAIDVDLLRPHPANPRRDLGDLTELADSIRAHGVRQNLLVVPDPDDPSAYRLVIGHRRTAAARMAGVGQLLAVVDEDLSEADQVALMLLENIQRSDLSAVEEADAYQGLLDLGMDEAAIADRTGRSRATVKARLKLVTLPETARQAVHTHAATLTDAAALEEFTDPEVRARLADALGTVDFHHALARERRTAEATARLQPFLDALAAGNATELPRDEWDTPKGMTAAFTIWSHGTTNATAREALEQLQSSIGPGWAWRWHYQDLRVFRPHTLEEANAAAEREQERAALKAQSQAMVDAAAQRRAEQDAANAAVKELAEVSATTRRDYLLAVIARRLTAAETTALVRFAGFEILMDGWHDRGGETTAAGMDNIPGWVGVDIDEVTARAADEELDADDAVDQEVTQAIARLDPPNRLVAALAAANEPIHAWQWMRRPADRSVLAWYALLEDLGYTPSTAERAAMQPPADDDATAA